MQPEQGGQKIIQNLRQKSIICAADYREEGEWLDQRLKKREERG